MGFFYKSAVYFQNTVSKEHLNGAASASFAVAFPSDNLANKIK